MPSLASTMALPFRDVWTKAQARPCATTVSRSVGLGWHLTIGAEETLALGAWTAYGAFVRALGQQAPYEARPNAVNSFLREPFGQLVASDRQFTVCDGDQSLGAHAQPGIRIAHEP